MTDVPAEIQEVFDDLDNNNEQDAFDEQVLLDELSALSLIEYDRRRNDAAKQLGIRPATLDKAVQATRLEVKLQQEGSVVEDLEPWPEPVDGAALLAELASAISRHVLLKPAHASALPLWCLGSFCMDAWRLFPKVLITSPEKRCGKSTLLETLEGMVYRPMLTSNISPAAIYRCIEAWTPTLLIDEADTFTRDNNALNGVINSGHTKRTAVAVRAEKTGDGFEPKKFSTWCPQVIAGIGTQRGTLHDRSIHIELIRALPGQKPNKLPGNYFEKMAAIRRKCARWAADHLEALQTISVQVPPCGNDRAEDNWNPLFALAAVAGGHWPEKALAAYLVFTESATDGEESAGHMLVEDISEIIADWPYHAIPSRVLVEKLIDLEDRPWCEWKRGKPLTQNSLARLLKPYSLVSNTIRIGNDTPKGFAIEKMRKAFAPYLSVSGVLSATVPQPAEDKGKSVALCENVAVQSATNVQSATQKPSKHKACGGVADKTTQVKTPQSATVSF